MYKFLCEPLFSFLLGMYLGMKLPDHMVIISCARSVFSFLRDCQTFFDCGCTIVHFQQHCRRPVSLHSCSVQSLSHVQLCEPMDCVAYQTPPSIEFSRKEYWSGVPFRSPGDLPGPGIEPWSPALQADTSPSEPPGLPYQLYDSHIFYLSLWTVLENNH